MVATPISTMARKMDVLEQKKAARTWQTALDDQLTLK